MDIDNSMRPHGQEKHSETIWYPSLVAVITVTDTGQGRMVNMLGMGSTETEARRAAFSFVNQGFNRFDEEYQGGQLVKVSDKLARLSHLANKWQDTIDETNQLVASSCPAEHIDFMSALTRLCLTNGELCYRAA